MTRPLLGILAFALLIGCSGAKELPDAGSEAIALVASPAPEGDADCFEEHCIDPATVNPEEQVSTEIAVPPPLDGGVLPDGTCVGQPEPACPLAPPGTRPQNPGIASGGQCRGACGKACPATCRPGPTESTCIEWQDATCGWHQKTCTYPTIECGTTQGCEDHDNCYDACARGWRGIACRRACDVTCVKRWGIKKCNSWRQGNGPYDSWLQFAGAATSGPVYDTTCY